MRRNKRDEEEDRAVTAREDKDEAEEEEANGAASIVKARKFSSLSLLCVSSRLFATESRVITGYKSLALCLH